MKPREKSKVAGCVRNGVVTKGVARPLSKKSVSSQGAKRKRRCCATTSDVQHKAWTVTQDDTDLREIRRQGKFVCREGRERKAEEERRSREQKV